MISVTLICQRDLHPIALLCHHLLTSHLLYSLAQGYQGSFSPTNLPFNHMTSSVCSSHPAPPLHRALLPPNRIASSPCSSCPPVMSILTPLRTPPLPSVHSILASPSCSCGSPLPPLLSASTTSLLSYLPCPTKPSRGSASPVTYLKDDEMLKKVHKHTDYLGRMTNTCASTNVRPPTKVGFHHCPSVSMGCY